MELVQVGNRTIPVVAQKHARLRHHLHQDDFQKVFSKDYGHETYRILSVLVPAIPLGVRNLDDPEKYTVDPFPEWEWEGFQSEDAWEAYKRGDRDVYDEDYDHSPTGAEIVDLFEKALMVNGANRLGNLLSLVRSGATLVEAQSTVNLPASPGENGASISTSSGTPAPTSIQNSE
jgi:hypothetical protein